jgi:hypothetical protein
LFLLCSCRLQKPDNDAFAEIWSKLQQTPKPSGSAPVAQAPVVVSRTSVDVPLAPCVNGQPLRPPPSWLRQNTAPDNGPESTDEVPCPKSQANEENWLLPSNAIRIEQLENFAANSTQHALDQAAAEAEGEKQSMVFLPILFWFFFFLINFRLQAVNLSIFASFF